MPTPVITFSGCLLSGKSSIHVDGIVMTEEDQTTDLDLSLCLSIIFCLYFLYDIAYPIKLSNTLKYIKRYVVGYTDNQPLPIRI